MVKKTITYTDFNDVERTEDFYFNLTEAEIVELQLGTTGGMAAMMKKIVDSKDSAQIIATFKKIVLKAYGEKSDDGRRFMKTPEITRAFEETEAYSQIFMELAFDASKAADFVNGIMPKSISESEEVAKRIAQIKADNQA